MSVPGDHIHHQPVVVITQIPPVNIEGFSRWTGRAIASDRIPGSRHFALPVSNTHHITGITGLLDFDTNMRCHIRMIHRFLTQVTFKLGLIEHGHRLPAITPKRPGLDTEHPLPPGIGKTRPVPRPDRLHQSFNGFTPLTTLECPDDLPIEVNSPWQTVNLGIPLKSHHSQACFGQQNSGGATHGAQPDKRNVVVIHGDSRGME